MESGLWEYFIQCAKSRPNQVLSTDLDRITGDVAALLTPYDSREVTNLLFLMIEQIVQKYELIQKSKEYKLKRNLRLTEMKQLADLGAPPGAPSPIEVPPEVIAEAQRTFNEAEILEAIQEIRAGRGVTFEEVMEELNSLCYDSKDTTRP